MKYRTKITASFLLIAAISSALGITILYQKTSEILTFELRTKVVSVAATASALINPELVQRVATSLDKNSADFQLLQNSLLSARDNNRRSDLFVKYLYILKPSPTNPQQVIFVAEAQNTVLPGDLDTQQSQSKIQEHLDEFYSPKHFIHDKWGIWMSGFAPIVDAKGNYVATIGVDISAASVISTLNQMLWQGFNAFAASLALAYFLSRMLSQRVTRALNRLCTAVKEIGHGKFHQQTLVEEKTFLNQDEFAHLAKAIQEMTVGLEEREKLKVSFSRYVSKAIMDQILSKETSFNLKGERRKITVLFSDIRHFTKIAEQIPPEEVVLLLNEYFDTMLGVIFRNKGTLDKFIGDGIMVEFGAPLNDSQQELHAVKAALEMQSELKKLCKKWEKEGKPLFTMGIGIHTGYAIVGNIGSEKRMEYTAIGDTVNVAARLEQATKQFKEPILISQETHAGLADQYPTKLLGTLALPGRVQETTVYALHIPNI